MGKNKRGKKQKGGATAGAGQTESDTHVGSPEDIDDTHARGEDSEAWIVSGTAAGPQEKDGGAPKGTVADSVASNSKSAESDADMSEAAAAWAGGV